MKNILNKIRTFFFYFKPRKLIAQYKLFYNDGWLELSMKSIEKHVDVFLLIVSDISWDKSVRSEDSILIQIEGLKKKYKDKLIVINGSWDNQLEQVNEGLNYIKENLQDITHCIYIDSDEIYLDSEIKRLKRLTFHPFFFNRAIRINYRAYFKSIFYKIVPEKWPLALSLFPVRSYSQFLNERNVSSKIVERNDIYFEHFSYVRKTDQDIYNKLKSHKASIEPILENWYEEVWLKWTPEMKNFHPTNPEFFERAEKISKEMLPNNVVENYLIEKFEV